MVCSVSHEEESRDPFAYLVGAKVEIGNASVSLKCAGDEMHPYSDVVEL